MKPKISRQIMWIGVIILSSAGVIRGEDIKLARSEVVIDFKEDGYYKTIPFVALQNDFFFICDNFTHRVLEYRLEGNKLEFIRAIGKPGQGPGDLMRPTEIFVSGDTLAVHDEFGISLFGIDGVFKRKYPLLSKSVTMLFAGGKVFSVNYDSRKKDLILTYNESGEILGAFPKKTSLYALRPEIHRGFSPDSLERTVFEGALLSSGEGLFYLNKRFGDVLWSDPAGANVVKWNLVPLLSKADKAKADENRRMFLDEGFDLIKNQRMIPNHYLFRDARIWNGRLFLLLDNYDILEHQARPFTEIAEIDLAARAIVRTYRADAAARFESASNFLIVGGDKTPVFLITMRVPGEDTTLWLFRPAR
jgi:hypothetical protein